VDDAEAAPAPYRAKVRRDAMYLNKWVGVNLRHSNRCGVRSNCSTRLVSRTMFQRIIFYAALIASST
jgi:hypothetical protein